MNLRNTKRNMQQVAGFHSLFETAEEKETSNEKTKETQLQNKQQYCSNPTQVGSFFGL